jgi:cullin 3
MVEARLCSVAELVAASPDDQLLCRICEQWKEHQVTMVMVRDILMYMDRTYVPQNKKMAVYDLGLRAFRETIARHELVRERLRLLLLENVRSERVGRLIDQTLMKSALYMLADLGIDSSSVYEEDFEFFFLQETRSFYRSESRLFLSKNSCPDYFKKVEVRISEEMARVRNYLHASTRQKLQHIIESELISAHAIFLVESNDSGFRALLKQSEEKMDDLKRIYNLFIRVPTTLNLLREALHEHARAAGHMLVNDEAKAKEPVEFLRGLLDLRKKYDSVVRNAFRGESLAQKKLKEAFESFINADTRCASYLVVYIDELMRSGFKGATECDVEHALDKVIIVFRYLHDKDIFEALYKQHLAKRLLNQRSTSSEAERQMLAKLKGECGYQFTTKLEGMFTDIKFSKDAMEKYRLYKEARQGFYTDRLRTNELQISRTVGSISLPNGELSDRPVDTSIPNSPNFHGNEDGDPVVPAHNDERDNNNTLTRACNIDVTMLTAGYWPMQSAPPCLLPAIAIAATEPFESFYLKQHTGRKLTWLTSSGTVELKATFSNTTKHELTVSTYQMCILVLFNTLDYGAELALRDISSATQIPNNELKRHIVSLCTPKHRILLKRSKGKGVTDNDTFKVNVSFTSKLKRVRIPLVAMKEAGAHPDSNDRVPASVEEDRRHLCEATVVRIMKARKHAKHNDLIAEVTRQLNQRFFPQPQFIKKSIESLLEREYLERNANDARMYTYLA